MAHLLAMNVPVKRDPTWSDWAKMTRAKIKSAGIPVNKWQLLYYHMTILFLDDDACAESFTPEFAQIVKSCPALSMTIDKIDAFTTTNVAEHIIYLSSTNVPEQILTLAKDARTLADGLNADYDKRPFLPHIMQTRCRSKSCRPSCVRLNNLRSAVSSKRLSIAIAGVMVP